jgi:pilus assembly protein Flp/PilA
MRVVFNDLVRNESGVTSIEYCFIAIMIALAIVAALTTLGSTLSNTFSTVANDI